MDKEIIALGLMSGTSLDGIDLALLKTDGQENIAFGAHMTRPYSPAEREVLLAALAAAPDWETGSSPPEAVRQASELVTSCHADAVMQFLSGNQMRADDIDLLGFHGQTVFHDPSRGRTEQIGDGAALARLTGIDVVADFRSADMANGGEGAPLVPLYHQALVRKLSLDTPVAVVNIGGVANVTWLDGGQLLGFDTGPGNALIDDWVRQHTGADYDRNGQLAASGHVLTDVLAGWLADAYFDVPPPKSLDRNRFSINALEQASAADGAATLTAFTALALACAVPHLPSLPKSWIICGGGRHNGELVKTIRMALDGAVMVAEDIGWPGDELEAQAFAWLAVRSRLELPLTLPETTGCRTPTCGGVFFKS